MLDKTEKVFSVITGILTVCIAIWIVFIGQTQFKTNLDQTIGSGKPILAIATSGYTAIKLTDEQRNQAIESNDPTLAFVISSPNSNYFEYLLKLQNYGDRPGYGVKIKLFTIGYNKSNNLEVIDKYEIISANSLAQNMQWDLGRQFSTLFESKIFIYLIIDYTDNLTNKNIKESFLFYIPEKRFLKYNIEGRLNFASLNEIDTIKGFINIKKQ